MADELVRYARKWLNKQPGDLTAEELNLLRAFVDAERRLAKVDAFIGTLR